MVSNCTVLNGFGIIDEDESMDVDKTAQGKSAEMTQGELQHQESNRATETSAQIETREEEAEEEEEEGEIVDYSDEGNWSAVSVP